MSHNAIQWPADKAEMYRLMYRQLESLIESCPLPIPCLANCSALLWEALKDINWAGFYMTNGQRLILGPFQGRVACTVIPFSKGVCGTAAASKTVQLVPDVHCFPGHIACDSASNSEVVIPLIRNDTVYGVMDIDSPLFDRFDRQDVEGLTALCKLLMDRIELE